MLVSSALVKLLNLSLYKDYRKTYITRADDTKYHFQTKFWIKTTDADAAPSLNS